MDGYFYFCIFVLCFAGLTLILAGVAYIFPPFAHMLTAKAYGFFDETHPKESAKLIAKMMLFIALGLGVGGLAGMLIGEYGFFLLPVSVIGAVILGRKVTGKDYEELKGVKGGDPEDTE